MRRVRALSMLLAVVPLSSCILTGRLDPAGGGRFTAKVRLVSVAHFEPTKAALQSADVTVKSASMTPDKWATFELECSDLTKLSTMPAFAHAIVAVTDEGGVRTIKVTVPNAAPDRLSDAYANYAGRESDLSVELPGEVTRSNGVSTSGRTVSWKWPTAELTHRRQMTITASYRRERAS
jgi:hypothetical protein